MGRSSEWHAHGCKGMGMAALSGPLESNPKYAMKLILSAITLGTALALSSCESPPPPPTVTTQTTTETVRTTVSPVTTTTGPVTTYHTPVRRSTTTTETTTLR